MVCFASKYVSQDHESHGFYRNTIQSMVIGEKTSMNLKKYHSLGGSQMYQCLWVSEDLGLVTSSWNLKCSQSQYLVSLDFDVF